MRFSANGTINWHNSNYMRIVSSAWIYATTSGQMPTHFAKCLFTQSVLPRLESQSVFQVRRSACIFIRSTDFRCLVFNPCCFRLRHFGSNIQTTTWTRYMWKSVNLNLARVLSAIKCQSKIDSILSKFWRVSRLQHIRIHAVIKERTVFLDFVE